MIGIGITLGWTRGGNEWEEWMMNAVYLGDSLTAENGSFGTLLLKQSGLMFFLLPFFPFWNVQFNHRQKKLQGRKWWKWVWKFSIQIEIDIFLVDLPRQFSLATVKIAPFKLCLKINNHSWRNGILYCQNRPKLYHYISMQRQTNNIIWCCVHFIVRLKLCKNDKINM